MDVHIIGCRGHAIALSPPYGWAVDPTSKLTAMSIGSAAGIGGLAVAVRVDSVLNLSYGIDHCTLSQIYACIYAIHHMPG